MNKDLPSELSSRPLSSFKELGKVAVNCLARNQIITLSDLLSLSKKDLLYIPYFGPKSNEQVMALLKKYQLTIKER